MTIAFMDGFDHYSSATLLGQKWTNDAIYAAGGLPGDGRLGSGFTFETGANRRGASGHSLGIPSGAGIRRRIYIPGSANGTGATIGVSIKRTVAGNRTLLFLGNKAGILVATVQWNTNGSFTVYDRGGANVFTTSPVAVGLAQFFYLELSIKFSDGASATNTAAYLYVNGTLAGTASGDFWVGNVASGNTFGTLGLGCSTYAAASSGPTFYADDVYVDVGTAASRPLFYSSVTIKTVMPVGSGGYSQFTGSDGNSVSNYALVDEVPPDTADYVNAPGTNYRDTYTIPIPVGAQTPQNIQYNTYAKRISGGGTLFFPTANAGLTTGFSNGPNWQGADGTGIIPTVPCVLTREAQLTLTGKDTGIFRAS